MAALQRLQEAGVRVDDIGLRRPSLDDVFLHLTAHDRQPVPELAGGAR
jgi:ABC-2 type transport system ATP-binding protein